MKKYILLFVLFFVTFSSYSLNNLTVSDPRSSWYSYQGTIEQASLVVKPKGVYFQYDLYLTFSSKGTYLTRSTDTLEVVLNFELPEKAIVIDSWLWIGNDIVKGLLQDRWSASAIYENIVKRRKDPSILFKNSATQYQLRIFPMAGNQTRKVKISYLTPATINNKTAYSEVPYNLLKASKTPVSVGVAMQKNNINWPTPINTPAILMKDTFDSFNGQYSKFLIPYSNFSKSLEIGYQRQISNLIDFAYFKEDNEGYYQMSFYPSDFISNQQNKKITVLLDYEIANTNMTTTGILDIVKEELKKNLTDKDSFNLFVSNINIRAYKNVWTVATDVNIENAISELSSSLSSYSNLVQLINSGINFIKNNGNDGSVLLISNSGQFGSNTSANSLINDISAITNKSIPFFISDFQSITNQYYFINNIYYYGNEYLYTNLARITGGVYFKVRDGLSENSVISQSLINSSGVINSFDLHTKLNSGYCYSRYNLNSSTSTNYSDPIVQVGRFNGSFPFFVEFSGEYNNKIFSKSIQIEEVAAQQCDTIVKQIWAGLYVKQLENQSQSSNIVNSIISGSLNNRVLSLYTAFLCLEDKNQICEECIDESGLTKLKVPESVDKLKVYPNPFVNELSIDVEIDKNDENTQLNIYNLTGLLVYKFDVNTLNNGKNTITWNGVDLNGNRVSAGIYILSFRNNTQSYNVRIMKK